mmetsp:Transcript_6869/g.41893  ORF Transcript_6869/g.41893 Transcript_6869/m.41893 type:complete len:216 (+) Transcript_6869:3754-4401(+)
MEKLAASFCHLTNSSPNLAFPSSLSSPWNEYRSTSRNEGTTCFGCSRSLQMMSAVSEARWRGLQKSASNRSSRSISAEVCACSFPFFVSFAKSLHPWMRPSAFHVLCPCRTKTTRLGVDRVGSGRGGRLRRSPKGVNSSSPRHVHSFASCLVAETRATFPWWNVGAMATDRHVCLDDANLSLIHIHPSLAIDPHCQTRVQSNTGCRTQNWQMVHA